MVGLFLNQKTNNNIRISYSLKYKHSKKVYILYEKIKSKNQQCNVSYALYGGYFCKEKLLFSSQNSSILHSYNIPYNSYVHYPTRGFIAPIRDFNLLTHAFNLATRAFNLLARAFNLTVRAFSLLTRGFELVARGFDLVTRELELVTRGFELVTRGFELVTHNS